ncbi:hypothetical protein [Actinokineospora sp.]|uniref:hypothetical protein n=1 Tax=Actinokineospora sp. TaxID=1872133 RepID=UPI003D6A0724
MDFWKTILSLIRRKRVGIPLLAASVMMGTLAFLIVPARYTSSTMLVLTTPASGATLTPDRPTGLTNPLLNFDDGLKTTSAILIQVLNTRETQRELGAGDGSGKLVVNDGGGRPEMYGSNGPFVYIEAVGLSVEKTRMLVDRALQRVRDELLNRQKALNAPPSSFITAIDVVQPSAPETVRGTQIQLTLSALVFTFVAGLAGVYGVGRTRAARRGLTPEQPAVEQNVDGTATVKFAPVPRPAANGNQATEAKVNGSGASEHVRR